MKLFYSLKRKVLAVCLFGMILMALCMGGISLGTISSLTYSYEIQNMNHVVDTKTAEIDDELLRSENIVEYATNSLQREIKDPASLRNPNFQRHMTQLVADDFLDAKSDLGLICSYYLYFPSENKSTLWMASQGRDKSFYDVLAERQESGSKNVPRHIFSLAYMMEQGQAAWSGPYYAPTLDRYIISYMSPVYCNGIMVAIIGVDLDFKTFMGKLYDDKPEGEHGMMILSDATGSMEYSLANPMGTKLEDKNIVLKDPTEKVGQAGKTDAEMLSYKWGNEDSIAGVKTLRNGMNLIDLRQKGQIYSRAYKAFLQMGIGLLTVCFLVSLLPLYIISRLSARLQTVIGAAQTVGAGKYDAVHLQDENPDDIGELSRNFQNMVEKVAASQEKLEHMSFYDALTGILNRMGLDREIAAWLKKHPKGKAALISLDLDGFKFINDLYGHMAGDEALRVMARDLRENFGSQHIIGRNGGDEFVVFMTDVTPETVEEVIRTFSKKLKQFQFAGETHVFSVSIGYALYQGDGMPLAKLFHQADTALYAVKLRGRNHYRIYDESMEQLSRSSLGFNLQTITSNLPTALLVSEGKIGGKILFINKAMVSLFECSNVSEFMNYTKENADNVICPCDRKRVAEIVYRELAENPGRTYSLIYRIRTAKGNKKWVSSIWRRAHNVNYGEVYYASIVEYEFIKDSLAEWPDELPPPVRNKKRDE
ncbi:diguanylate cyclase domain-containing protein [Mitsuokella sp. WILCCON 0060]|uniref:diguanylate cyclase domain-containing protein n=1 Tax=unclassified Mitsuokella TaxID=2637239 RepID=UPI003F01F7C7